MMMICAELTEARIPLHEYPPIASFIPIFRVDNSNMSCTYFVMVSHPLHS